MNADYAQRGHRHGEAAAVRRAAAASVQGGSPPA
ncbi:hypothetical protein H4W32_000363 [Actinophytocola algeriensis]|uniref:Uncharacterized protein n=1 Tax=Actinophytocola algeriensis TaxID=1768010 RepID=A0A7W7Q2Z6_9PSEU|nr:hypothetical protein [Actinophytocola algeriensis]MBE1472321.1 hypothetical protein [Actinophytocola algeriensis]